MEAERKLLVETELSVANAVFFHPSRLQRSFEGKSVQLMGNGVGLRRHSSNVVSGPTPLRPRRGGFFYFIYVWMLIF